MEKNVDFNKKSTQDKTAALYAIDSANYNALRTLLNKGLSMNHRDQENCNSLSKYAKETYRGGYSFGLAIRRKDTHPSEKERLKVLSRIESGNIEVLLSSIAKERDLSPCK